MIKNILFTMIFLCLQVISNAQLNFEIDTIATSQGKLVISFIGHGTLMMNFNNLVIHIDPVYRYADYSKLPKADIILITHHHGDHLDLKAIDTLKKENTKIICTELCYAQLKTGTIMKNGDIQKVYDINIEAVPAYNIVHKNNNGNPFHLKGQCNGYVITFGDKRIYIAGDTENIPEMKDLKNIDIAFLPMNLPYTMTPEMVADAVNMINPKVLYPYHYGNTNVKELIELLKDKKDCEIRIRKMN
ncbi:MBL fold metallo-hydrolase [Rosettibacter firmus]|uniref:MBL fold metallo-hydrolase n=1 Tax=Rosettibacter firmus TaxID=3111522 RepID=UPI00336C051E